MNGKIIEENLRNEMYNLDDLMEAIRIGGYPNPADIAMVILETGGNISIVPKGAATNLTPGDMKIAKEDTVVWGLVHDGEIDERNMVYAGIDRKRLQKEIRAAGANGLAEVLYCNVDNSGTFYIQLKK